jgi:hypothetical protein
MKDIFISLPILGVCSLIFLFTADRETANLVANGNFEIGDVSSRTIPDDPSGSEVVFKRVTPRHDTLGAAIGPTDTISEAWLTIPATLYDLGFLYQVGMAENSPADNKFGAFSNSVTGSQSNLNPGSGRFSSAGMVGPGNLTALVSAEQNALLRSNAGTGSVFLDQVVAVTSPVPDAGSSALLMALALIGLAGIHRIRAHAAAQAL